MTSISGPSAIATRAEAIGRTMITVRTRQIVGQGPHMVHGVHGVQHIVHVASGPATFSPWAGFGILGAYAAALLVLGTLLLVRRDV